MPRDSSRLHRRATRTPLTERARYNVAMLCETFAAGRFQCNCSIVAAPTTREAIVIDPGARETERIAAIVRANDLIVTAIVHTHAHLDHVFATAAVKQAPRAAACACTPAIVRSTTASPCRRRCSAGSRRR
jgi:glyoxylase-like metal-dependent hydrolase (beta-lactamase superfamily II)